MMTQSQEYKERLASASEIECAYLAGIVDGEGCIEIVCNKAAWRQNARTDNHVLRLAVGMTDEATIDWIISKIGGRKRSMTFGQRNGLAHVRTPAYHVLITSQHCVDTLLRLRPYLICKRAEADLGIEFYSATKWDTTRRIPGHKGQIAIPQEIMDLRNEYMHRMRDLKPRSLRTRLNRELRAQGLIAPPES